MSTRKPIYVVILVLQISLSNCRVMMRHQNYLATRIKDKPRDTSWTNCPFGDGKKICSDAGTCYNGKCFCNPGFDGVACENVAFCPKQCSGNGICYYGKCYCVPGFEGVTCSVSHDKTLRKTTFFDVVFLVLVPLIMFSLGVAAGASVAWRVQKIRIQNLVRSVLKAPNVNKGSISNSDRHGTAAQRLLKSSASEDDAAKLVS